MTFGILDWMSTKKKKALFLFSDIGGGHRSSTEATIAAMEKKYHTQLECEMVDVFRDYTRRPFHKLPDLYPKVTKMPSVWNLTYRLTDGQRRKQFLEAFSAVYSRVALDQMIADHTPDLIVSLHQLTNGGVLNNLERRPDAPPFATVVTDLVGTHNFWFDPRVDSCIVPTDLAAIRAREAGIDKRKLYVLGLPINSAFRPISESQKAKLKQQLGLETDRPAILLIGGGEGMGKLWRIARSLNRLQLPISLVVICGRNEELQNRFEIAKWKIPVQIHGFTKRMPEYMQASDVVVTKAGPSTICEAMNTHRPVILYDYLPGQEEDNVTYILEQEAGVWAPKSSQINETLQRWLDDPTSYAQVVQNCTRLAHPEAAENIASQLAELINI